ncbi:MAG: MOSC domain-containing protein [Chloroflexi bacterium]|nr:MOSC domain-containing protein [Chloroflexota bacterium]
MFEVSSPATEDDVSTRGGRVGRLVQISVSDGGAPKRAVERATVGRLGIEGDRQRNRRFHGGPSRAVCLLAMESIERLRAEGHPIMPGSTGENLTVAGLDAEALSSGVRLRIGGQVVIEITRYTTPCKNIRGSFKDGEFSRMSHLLHPGDSRVYARVLVGGEIGVGNVVCALSSTPTPSTTRAGRVPQGH